MGKEEHTHFVGTFLVEAPASFLNGKGIESGEVDNLTAPKYFHDGAGWVPYVSAQSWRRWLRNTLIQETGWKPSELRSIKENVRGNVSQVRSEINPIEFAEDDIFGYMDARSSKKKDEDDESEDEDTSAEDKPTKKPKERVKSVMRASPFASSLLFSIRRLKALPQDEGYVHLKQGTPLPYSTKFYSTHMQAIFSLEYSRLGLFSNVGDRIELDENIASTFLLNGKIRVEDDLGPRGKTYKVVDGTLRQERTAALLRALVRLRGGAKQAQFATDVAPKFLILAGLNSGNPIFNQLYMNNDEKHEPTLDIKRLREIISDYSDRLITPVYVGMRTGYIQNEAEIRELAKESNVIIGTPIEIVEQLVKELH